MSPLRATVFPTRSHTILSSPGRLWKVGPLSAAARGRYCRRPGLWFQISWQLPGGVERVRLAAGAAGRFASVRSLGLWGLGLMVERIGSFRVGGNGNIPGIDKWRTEMAVESRGKARRNYHRRGGRRQRFYSGWGIECPREQFLWSVKGKGSVVSRYFSIKIKWECWQCSLLYPAGAARIMELGFYQVWSDIPNSRWLQRRCCPWSWSVESSRFGGGSGQDRWEKGKGKFYERG